jgi:hypothetical protein
MPVELENLAMTGVDGVLKCGAVESVLAIGDGVKVPWRRMPLAWAVEGHSELFHRGTTVSSITWTESWRSVESIFQRRHQLLSCLDHCFVSGKRHGDCVRCI